jgi:hypothetical protein
MTMPPPRPVRALVVVLSALLALLAAGCSGSGSSSRLPEPPATVQVGEVAKATPSESARMVCEKEAVEDIYNSATGERTVAHPKAAWDKSVHLYTCVYRYARGAQMTLSVKELSSTAETTAYFDKLASQLGKAQEIAGIGQGAFQVENGSVVVRKDYKVMLVDITKLPAHFGLPPSSPGTIAVIVAETIMGCWTGD